MRQIIKCIVMSVLASFVVCNSHSIASNKEKTEYIRYQKVYEYVNTCNNLIFYVNDMWGDSIKLWPNICDDMTIFPINFVGFVSTSDLTDCNTVNVSDLECINQLSRKKSKSKFFAILSPQCNDKITVMVGRLQLDFENWNVWDRGVPNCLDLVAFNSFLQLTIQFDNNNDIVCVEKNFIEVN